MAYDLAKRALNQRNFALGSSNDPLVWTPSAVKSELARVLVVLDTVNTEVSQAAKEGKVTSSEWVLWRQEYLSSHKFLAKASSLWGSNALAARQQEQNALKWRELVKSRGGQIVGPPDLGRKLESSFNTVTIALAVAGTAGTAMLINAIRKR